MTARDIFKALHGRRDPYHDVRPATGDVRGWNDAGEFFAQVARSVQVRGYLEVGSWCGGSMVRAMEVFAPEWAVAVDTWLGAAEHWIDQANPTHDLARAADGDPGIYDEFRRNMVARGYQDRVCPFRLSSTVAAPVLEHFGVTADLVYIDGAHDRESVAADCRLYAPLARTILCGDDWGDPRFEVAEGVVDWMRTECVPMRRLSVFRGNFWCVWLGRGA